MIPPAEGKADGDGGSGRTRRWMDRRAARTYSSTKTRLTSRRMPTTIAIFSCVSRERMVSAFCFEEDASCR